MEGVKIILNCNEFLLAFDFDGVVWNSVDECFFVGYPVFRKKDGEIDGSEAALLKKFREGRYLAKTGDDFYIIFHIIQENPNIDFGEVSFEEFRGLREKHPVEMLDFADSFYNERKRMKEEELSKWLYWQEPYKPVLEQLPGLKEQFFDLAICSTKDEASIRMLLERHGQNYSVYGREHSKFKPDQMIALSREKGIALEKIIFIDDLPENLRHVEKIGAMPVLADWGYNNPGGREEARKLGFPIISMKDIAGQVKQIIEEKQVRSSG